MIIRSLNKQHLKIAKWAALAILLPCQLGITMALQPTLVNLVSSRHQISIFPPMTCQWSASVDETDLTEEAQVAYDWDEQFEELRSFKAKYGHCNFPQNQPATEMTDEYPTLARFCQDQKLDYQRFRRRRKSTSKANLQVFDRTVRFRRLKELGFEFSIGKWYEKYHELVEYKRRNGDMRVRKRGNKPLYLWIKHQRSHRTTLSTAQIKLLDNIGFQWEFELYDVLWYAKYNELLDFRKKHGHLDVRRKSNAALAAWISWQRSRYARKEGRPLLSEEQIQLLDDIQFSWAPTLTEARWLKTYNDLVNFQKQNGHLRPKQLINPKLKWWAHHQRMKHDKGLLAEDQVELLNKIDFPWKEMTKKWDDMYRELKDFHREKGHLRVNQVDNPDLYDWMTSQRKRYFGLEVTRSSMDKPIEKLEETSLCWSLDGKERAWHEKYTEAVEFYKEHDHIQVAKKNNPGLHNWIATQGKRYKATKGHKPLSSLELELLEQIDFPFFENQPRMTWAAMYEDLVRYQKENDGRFPTSHRDNPDLNRWMRQQRNRIRATYGYVPLSDEQKSALESIDFRMLHHGVRMRFWYEKFDELSYFRQKHGHFLVDMKQYPSLDSWIKFQRRRFQGAPLYGGSLPKLQEYLLEKIEFPWVSDRNEVEWHLRYDELVEFSKEHGHILVKEAKNRVLATWINTQRSRYRGYGRTKLSAHQIELLQKIGFRW